MKKSATNTTVQNISKLPKLSKEHVFPKHIVSHPDTTKFLSSLLKLDNSKEEILYSLGKQLLAGNNNPLVFSFLQEYSYSSSLTFDHVPNEYDLLGAAYQYLNSKYENLAMGSFYTSKKLALELLEPLTFDNGETILDPSCGSGVFLFAADVPPENLYGIDYDPIAVMIAKFNYFLKFPQTTHPPQIFEADFLHWYSLNSSKRYTYVVGNPPYGANLDLSKISSRYIRTGESFSYFIEYGYYLLEDKGLLSYLIPESLLTVKRHIDVRDFILTRTCLSQIKQLNNRFSGVMSNIYQLNLSKGPVAEVFRYTNLHGSSEVKISSIKSLKNHIFAFLDDTDNAIINKVFQHSSFTLKDSTFGLGVVTGNNTEKLLLNENPNTEPIFTGKEVEKYSLAPAKRHLVFNRSELQQVARDEIYRTPVKLVYKVISKRLKVAIDQTKSLTTNSANIIIPSVPNNDAYSVALLLNSDLYSFLNQKLHGGVNKISRENLEALPFPSFTKLELTTIKELIFGYLDKKITEDELQDYVYSLFSITKAEQRHIEKEIV